MTTREKASRASSSSRLELSGSDGCGRFDSSLRNCGNAIMVWLSQKAVCPHSIPEVRREGVDDALVARSAARNGGQICRIGRLGGQALDFRVLCPTFTFNACTPSFS